MTADEFMLGIWSPPILAATWRYNTQRQMERRFKVFTGILILFLAFTNSEIENKTS